MKRTLLIVAAHPDDEVLGCFGTVAKMIQDGWVAYTLILSGGKTSRGIVNSAELDNLRVEMKKANSSIGIEEVFHADFPDNAFDSVPLLNIVKEIEKVKRQVSPEIIFTHHTGDMNIDHHITHRAVLTATRPMVDESVHSIYAMEVPSSTEWNCYSKESAFIPNIFVDITDAIDKKIEAMAMYSSELREYPHPRSLQHLRELARTNGVKVGLNYSENFMLVRHIVRENVVCM